MGGLTIKIQMLKNEDHPNIFIISQQFYILLFPKLEYAQRLHLSHIVWVEDGSWTSQNCMGLINYGRLAPKI